jgi:hypothetical protein
VVHKRDITSCLLEVSQRFLEEHSDSIFRAEECAKQETSMKQAANCRGDGGDMFHQNVGQISTDCTLLCPS